MRRTEETDSFLREKVLDFTHLVLGMRTGVEDEHKRAPPLPCTGERKKERSQVGPKKREKATRFRHFFSPAIHVM